MKLKNRDHLENKKYGNDFFRFQSPEKLNFSILKLWEVQFFDFQKRKNLEINKNKFNFGIKERKNLILKFKTGKFNFQVKNGKI